MKKEGIQTRNRKISTKLKKAQKDQRLDSNFRFLDRSGLPWGGYGMGAGPFHPGFPTMSLHPMTGLPTSYATQMALPPPPISHAGAAAAGLGAHAHQGGSPFAPGAPGGVSPFTGLPLNPSTSAMANPSTMAFG